MPGSAYKLKNVLFVDDDPDFLTGLELIFTAKAAGRWSIATATSHAQALERLGHVSMDLVVVDIGMPVMDGLQFLKLLRLTNPGQQTAVLTGMGGWEHRKTASENGVALFLEKPINAAGYETLFMALDTLINNAPQTGFQGMMRRVGLQEVLQIECLNRKDSILEVFTSGARGRIYICQGMIVHAECGDISGDVALFGLLGLHGGQFNFLVYQEPARRTITGDYEYLLLEAARLKDEGAILLNSGMIRNALQSLPVTTITPTGGSMAADATEMLLCSGSGEVLHARNCDTERRISLITSVAQQADQISSILPSGRFDRLEVLSGEGRVVFLLQPHIRLMVRSQPVAPSIHASKPVASPHLTAQPRPANPQNELAIRAVLANHPRLPGLIAWGIRMPDRHIISQPLDGATDAPQIERTLARALLASDSLHQHQLTPIRLQWRFEKLSVCLAARRDQHALCLILQRQEDAFLNLPESLLASFDSLNLQP